MKKRFLILCLASTFVLGQGSCVFAETKSDLQSVIADMQKVQIEKAEIVAALKHAQMVKSTAIIIGVSSALVTVVWPFVTQRSFNDSFGQYEQHMRQTYKIASTLITSIETPIVAALTTAASTAVAGYYQFRSYQYRVAIETIQKEVDLLDKQILALTAVQ